MEQQSTNTVLMIQPRRFAVNPETFEDNHFILGKNKPSPAQAKKIAQFALLEFSDLHSKLVKKGVKVVVFSEDLDRYSPDSVFPNNWFSTHEKNKLVLYPVKSVIRRLERRTDIIEILLKKYKLFLDLTQYESDSLFLESTGSLILDRPGKVAYIAISTRTDLKLAKIWAEKMQFQLIHFNAADKRGAPIYHTNVILSIGSDFAVVCLEAIQGKLKRKELLSILQKSGKQIIDISLGQVNNFCGNILELRSMDGSKVIVMSTKAYENFTDDQFLELNKFGFIIHSSLTTIETFGGGSARCMLAELF